VRARSRSNWSAFQRCTSANSRAASSVYPSADKLGEQVTFRVLWIALTQFKRRIASAACSAEQYLTAASLPRATPRLVFNAALSSPALPQCHPELVEVSKVVQSRKSRAVRLSSFLSERCVRVAPEFQQRRPMNSAAGQSWIQLCASSSSLIEAIFAAGSRLDLNRCETAIRGCCAGVDDPGK